MGWNLLSRTKIPRDDILEGLYKIRIRDSEKLKTVLELYDLEIHQKKLGPDHHRLKTMVKRSIEQEIRNKNFQDNTEIPADPQEEQVPQTSIKVVAARSKAKAKPQPRELAGTTTTIPIHQRRWIDIETSKQDLDSFDLSKKVINLLRHNQTLHREEDGAIEFCKIKFHLRNHHSQIQNWSDDRWKACLAAGGGSKRRYQYCSDNWEQLSTSVLFKDIREAILSILRYRTMC